MSLMSRQECKGERQGGCNPCAERVVVEQKEGDSTISQSFLISSSGRG